jgi:Family of unknown function (DUF5677)
MARKSRGKRHIKQKAFDDLNISGLEDYRRQGGTLTPPLATLPGTTVFASWKDAGLNEVLWAALLCGELDRETYLALFRQIVVNARSSVPNRQDTYVTHSVLSVLPDAVFDIIVQPLLQDSRANDVLRSLLLLESLPDRHHWARNLSAPDIETHSVFLMQGVATCLDHQSQEATDIRWLKICYFAMVCDRIHFPQQMHEMIEGFRLYPDYGDQRKVRPSVRALEIGLRMNQDSSGAPQEVPPALVSVVPKAWNEAFWKECFIKTPCIPITQAVVPVVNADAYLRELFEVYKNLSDHFILTTSSTDIDARHDATFGITLFAINLAIGAGRGNVHRRAEGRLILRTVVENYITLKFLEQKDDTTIWLQYRNYGVGQSKLSLLKNLRTEDLPEFINLEDLQRYANEDMWQEFTTINLKSWAERSIRKMADEAGVKDTYDRYYDWSSGYVHGHWGAVRDSVFTGCLNPLHRYHRIPFVPRLDMPSVLPDAGKILNLMIEIVNHLYPTFKRRIKHPSPPPGAPSDATKAEEATLGTAEGGDSDHSSSP